MPNVERLVKMDLARKCEQADRRCLTMFSFAGQGWVPQSLTCSHIMEPLNHGSPCKRLGVHPADLNRTSDELNIEMGHSLCNLGLVLLGFAY